MLLDKTKDFTQVVMCACNLSPHFICGEVGHCWKYPLAKPDDGDFVYSRTCIYCKEIEMGIFERRGLTLEKIDHLIQITLQDFPIKTIESDNETYSFLKIYQKA